MAFRSKNRNSTSYDKIEVSSNGDFYMSSKNIFNNKEASLLLISKLKSAVENYKVRTPEISKAILKSKNA